MNLTEASIQAASKGLNMDNEERRAEMDRLRQIATDTWWELMRLCNHPSDFVKPVGTEMCHCGFCQVTMRNTNMERERAERTANTAGESRGTPRTSQPHGWGEKSTVRSDALLAIEDVLDEMSRIISEHPAVMEYETDARDTWPTRWNAILGYLKAKRDIPNKVLSE